MFIGEKNMVHIPFKEKMHPKNISVLFIVVLIIIGLIVGIILSMGSVYRANKRIDEINPNAQLKPGFPIFGMTLVTINIFLLLGLIYTLVSIFRKTKSKFLLGLLLFLFALLIKSFFAYSSIQLIAIASAIRDSNVPVGEILGFSGTGLGAILIIYHIFEFIALSVFLYVSRE